MAIGSVRDDFPTLRALTHLNSGGMAPIPTAVLAELVRLPNLVAAEGPYRLQHHVEEVIRNAYAHDALARLLNVAADEIAFTTQFSTGVSLVLEGMDWQPGDEVVTTDQEHPALLTPLLNIARRRGLVIRRIAVDPDPAVVIAALARVVGPRTRLLAVSHITTEDGTILPVAELVRQVHAVGGLALIDGAHALGQLPLDLATLDCDFFAFVGYKWLFGPYPSAGIVIRRHLLDRIAVTWTGSRVTTSASVDMDLDQLQFIDGAARFEYGGRVFAYDSAMAVGADYVANLGVPTILEHARGLAGWYRQELEAIGGVTVHGPRQAAAGCGIVTFSLAGVDGVRLSTALRERANILTRPALRGQAVRTSIAAFTTEAELGAVVDLARTLAAGG